MNLTIQRKYRLSRFIKLKTIYLDVKVAQGTSVENSFFVQNIECCDVNVHSLRRVLERCHGELMYDAERYDDDTYKTKQASKSLCDLPSLSELINFFDNKFHALEPISKRGVVTKSSYRPYPHNMINDKPYNMLVVATIEKFHIKNFKLLRHVRRLVLLATASTTYTSAVA